MGSVTGAVSSTGGGGGDDGKGARFGLDEIDDESVGMIPLQSGDGLLHRGDIDGGGARTISGGIEMIIAVVILARICA